MKTKVMTDSPVLTYYNMGDGVVAFSTTRHGGCGNGYYAAFNINEYCGDAPGAVRINRETLATVLGIGEERIVVPRQTHGIEVRNVDSLLVGKPEAERKTCLDGVDAVMTVERGLCVGVSTADCIPVLLYDMERHAVCAVHAGWRGTVARIVQKAVAEMSKVFMTEPSMLRAVIGPGISLDCFEVGDEVYDRFVCEGFDMGQMSVRKDKWHIDLPKCNLMQLEEMGVDVANVLMSGICTYKSVKDYFSARRLGVRSGRIYSGIMMA